MANILFRDVRKSYGELEIIKGFNLSISDGEFVVLVGPSGCGKSTALKILAGLEAPTRGSVFIGEQDVTDIAPGERDIAMVFQNYALYPHMSVRRNLGFGLAMRNTPEDEIKRQVAYAATLLSIDHLLDRKPKELSGGQRQRVALGRALVRRPKAFLMDEPLSNLDSKLRAEMRSEITALHCRLAATTLYVTHDQTEAMTMANRIVVMKDGLIQQIGPPEEVYSSPANVFVASFIGSPSMNFALSPVTISDHQAHVKLFDQDIAIPSGPSMSRRPSGANVIVGIRPEHFAIGTQPRAASFHVTPFRVENLGTEKHVYFNCAAGLDPEMLVQSNDAGKAPAAFVARVMHSSKLPDAEPVALSIDPSRVYLFDAETLELCL